MAVQHHVSELHEEDAIRGGNPRLRALVDRAAGLSSVELYVLNHLCTPVVVGDDLAAAAATLAERTGRPVFEITRHTKLTQTLLERMFDAVAGAGEPPAPTPSVCLLGFPRRFREEELLPFLAGLGVAVNVALLPEVSFEGLRRLARGTWHVRWSGSPWDAALDAILPRLGGTVVTVDAPFGPRACEAALRQIADAVGRSAGFASAWEMLWSPVAEAWSVGRSALRGQQVGFVLDPAQWRRMQVEGHLDVPMVDVLLEMGVDLEVWLHDPPGAPGTAPPAGVTLRTFETEAELAAGLRESPCAAFYSDVATDHRLARAGKAQLSRRCFEMGTQGALRGLASLQALCDLPFYRRYARFLQGEA